MKISPHRFDVRLIRLNFPPAIVADVLRESCPVTFLAIRHIIQDLVPFDPEIIPAFRAAEMVMMPVFVQRIVDAIFDRSITISTTDAE